ncbi:MAG: sialate O-acetylesterase [Paludibacter sp.]
MKTRIFIFFICLSIAFSLPAKIKVASILGDNMVLQRNTEVKLWGNANPNEKLKVKTGWNKKTTSTTSNDKGEWLVKVKTTEAGGPYSIEITSSKEKLLLKNILLGEVWVCSGQSNMEMTLAGVTDSPVNGMNDALVNADNENIRLFTLESSKVPNPSDTCVGTWKQANAESVTYFSAVGYFYAKLLEQKLKVPVGMICAAVGGSKIEAWMNRETCKALSIPLGDSIYLKKNGAHQMPTYLYNGMIHPIINFSIKGVIWYQGESNINYKEYTNLMVGLVANWRKDFDVGDFPFYYVQIAPYIVPYFENKKKNTIMAMQSEAQLNASNLIPNCGMVSTLDIGEENNIHPAEKFTVSKRLSYWALSETYGFKGIFHKNTEYKSIIQKDSSLVVSFKNEGSGLSSYGKELDNFEVAGEDHVFHKAQAKISNKQVLVWSSEVPKPIAVRYAFYNFPQGKVFLYNMAGLPVPLFRSDNWEK